MGTYSKFINETRRSVNTPKDLVDENGNVVFGTFDKEFETMNLVRSKRPTKLPDIFNKFKLTMWEACEINLKNGILLTAVCNMGVFGKVMNVFFDKRTKDVYCWDSNIKSSGAKISENLIRGAVSQGKSKSGFVEYENHFEKGKANLKGKHSGNCLVTSQSEKFTAVENRKNNRKKCEIEFEFSLTRISKPCVVSIPFPYSDNRCLYSQKDFFKAEGKLVINGEEMLSDENTCAIIDDHRGFYPRRASFDWATSMGKCKIDGKDEWFAINLTRNQSIDPEKYNENLIWFEDKVSLLPPVEFTRSVESKDFKNHSEWFIKDKHDMVNLTFKVQNLNPMILHAGIVSIDYFITFGEMQGYVRDEDGKKYELDGMIGIGEDKNLLF